MDLDTTKSEIKELQDWLMQTIDNSFDKTITIGTDLDIN